jgi:hypothetical protein
MPYRPDGLISQTPCMLCHFVTLTSTNHMNRAPHPVRLREGLARGFRTGIALYVGYLGPPGMFCLALGGGRGIGSRLRGDDERLLS